MSRATAGDEHRNHTPRNSQRMPWKHLTQPRDEIREQPQEG